MSGLSDGSELKCVKLEKKRNLYVKCAFHGAPVTVFLKCQRIMVGLVQLLC